MGGGAGAERDVTISPDVAGTLAMPDAGGAHACVLMLHGFGGSRDEAGGLFAMLARRLLDKAIGSLRIDLPGARDPQRVFAGATLGRYRDAGIAALRFLTRLEAVDRRRIGLLGFSLGAAVAIACLSGPVAVRTLALWGAAMRPRDDLAESFGRDAMRRAERNGVFELDRGGARVVVERAFLDSLAALSPFDDLARYRGCVLALAGTRDRHAKYIDQIAAAAGEAQMTMPGLIDGADHFFNAGTKGDPITGAALTITTDALEKMLMAS